MKTSVKTFGVSAPAMRVTEQGVPLCVAPNVIPARKGPIAEPIGERLGWHSETQERQRGAVAQTECSEALADVKAQPSVAGRQSRLSTLEGPAWIG